MLAVQYYMFLRQGFEGYRRIMQHTLDNAIALRKTLVDSGYFTIMNGSAPDCGLTIRLRLRTRTR